MLAPGSCNHSTSSDMVGETSSEGADCLLLLPERKQSVKGEEKLCSGEELYSETRIKLCKSTYASNASNNFYTEVKNPHRSGSLTSGYYSRSTNPSSSDVGASDLSCYQNLEEASYRSHRNVPMSSSCLTTRNKLIILCCCAALVAFISSVMVINAFLNWSKSAEAKELAKDQATPGHTVPQVTIPQKVKDGLITHSIADNHYRLDIEISINEVTTPSSEQITEIRRKWFEVQKINTISDDEDNDGTDINIIDLDINSVSDSSGSGMDSDDELNSDVTILPIRTNGPAIKQLTTPHSGLDNSKNNKNGGQLNSNTEQSTLKPDSSILRHIHNSISQSGDNSDFVFPPETVGHENSDGERILGVSTYHIGSPVTPASTSPGEDKCERWLTCEDPFLKSYVEKFSQLPTCPCTYPLTRSYQIYDEYHKKTFTWRDADHSSSYLMAYHKGAKRCIRSEVGEGTLAAQNCCYDVDKKLLTRGSGAGTPDVISPDVSGPLHQLVDKVPWLMCRGDWTRYNIARPPNNMQRCVDNPPQMEYLYQIWLAKSN